MRSVKQKQRRKNLWKNLSAKNLKFNDVMREWECMHMQNWQFLHRWLSYSGRSKKNYDFFLLVCFMTWTFRHGCFSCFLYDCFIMIMTYWMFCRVKFRSCRWVLKITFSSSLFLNYIGRENCKKLSWDWC